MTVKVKVLRMFSRCDTGAFQAGDIVRMSEKMAAHLAELKLVEPIPQPDNDKVYIDGINRSTNDKTDALPARGQRRRKRLSR